MFKMLFFIIKNQIVHQFYFAGLEFFLQVLGGYMILFFWFLCIRFTYFHQQVTAVVFHYFLGSIWHSTIRENFPVNYRFVSIFVIADKVFFCRLNLTAFIYV